MNHKMIIDALTGLGTVIDAAGAKRSAEDIKSLCELFPADRFHSAEEALGELRKLLEVERENKRATHLKQLREAECEEVVFSRAVNALEIDKSVDADDINAIAHAYTEGRVKWPSRKAAIKAIRSRFVERSYQQSKMKIVERFRLG